VAAAANFEIWKDESHENEKGKERRKKKEERIEWTGPTERKKTRETRGDTRRESRERSPPKRNITRVFAMP